MYFKSCNCWLCTNNLYSENALVMIAHIVAKNEDFNWWARIVSMKDLE